VRGTTAGVSQVPACLAGDGPCGLVKTALGERQQHILLRLVYMAKLLRPTQTVEIRITIEWWLRRVGAALARWKWMPWRALRLLRWWLLLLLLRGYQCRSAGTIRSSHYAAEKTTLSMSNIWWLSMRSTCVRGTTHMGGRATADFKLMTKTCVLFLVPIGCLVRYLGLQHRSRYLSLIVMWFCSSVKIFCLTTSISCICAFTAQGNGQLDSSATGQRVMVMLGHGCRVFSLLDVLCWSYSALRFVWPSNSCLTWSRSSLRRLFGAGPAIPRWELYILIAVTALGSQMRRNCG